MQASGQWADRSLTEECWTRRCSVEPQVCTESGEPRVAGCKHWQQQFGLQVFVQKVRRQADGDGANLAVRTRKWAGCP
jgi:hypothetical protein